MQKVKEFILGYLRSLRKACNPIRWLGYVRPEEVTGTKFQDTTDERIPAPQLVDRWSSKRDDSVVQLAIGTDIDGDYEVYIIDPDDQVSDYIYNPKLYCNFPPSLLEDYLKDHEPLEVGFD